MSFSSSTGVVAFADLPAAIDTLQPTPPLKTDEAKTLFATAQAAAKSVAAVFDGGYPVVVNISGHACQEEGDSVYDLVAISVGEVSVPVPQPVKPAPTDPVS